MEIEPIKLDFIINSDSKCIQYHILGIIPAKIQIIKVINNEIDCSYIDSYKVRYKLMVEEFESPVSEIKDLIKFKQSEQDEILLKAGLEKPNKEKVEVAEITYV